MVKRNIVFSKGNIFFEDILVQHRRNLFRKNLKKRCFKNIFLNIRKWVLKFLNNVWHVQFKQCVCHAFNACGMTSAVNSAGTNMETIIYSALVVYLMSKSNLMTSRLNVNTKNFMIIKVRPNNLNVFVKCRFTRYSTI